MLQGSPWSRAQTAIDVRLSILSAMAMAWASQGDSLEAREVLRLALLPRERLVLLADRADEVGDARPEEARELAVGHAAVLDDVVERPGGDHLVVEPVAGEDGRDARHVADVGDVDAGVLALLIAVPHRGVVERALEERRHRGISPVSMRIVPVSVLCTGHRLAISTRRARCSSVSDAPSSFSRRCMTNAPSR